MALDAFADGRGQSPSGPPPRPPRPVRDEGVRWGDRGAARPRNGSEAARRRDSIRQQTDILAHDFNNLLGVILAANEALAQRAPEGSDAHELAMISQDAAEKGAALLRRIVELSSPHAAYEAAVDCAEVLIDTARMANVATSAMVTVVARALPSALTCRVDRAGLESALLNLCVNAGHALPQGGVVQVSGDVAFLTGETAAAIDVAPGAYVAISVTDPGVGMSAEVLARATDPYFTTRSGSGGTGLGLSGVKAFALRAGGALCLVSEEGRGTTATLYLPAA